MHKDIRSVQVMRGHQCHDGLLADYCDGSAYRSHKPFFHTRFSGSSDNGIL